MLTKHYLQRAFMNHRQNENLLTDLLAVPFQFIYETCWDFWHDNSLVSSLDTGKIGMQNLFYYHKHKMTAEECRKANKITLKIYEALIKSQLFVNVSKDKQYFSFVYDRYFEYVDLPRVLTRIYSDKRLKKQQEIRIQFDANQVKAIESDKYMTILNQVLAGIDDDLTVSSLTVEDGWYVYKLNDMSVNYRINLSDFKDNNPDNYTIYLDGGHKWDLSHQFGGLIAGVAGSGKTSLLLSTIYLLMQKKNVRVWVRDGKNDQLGAVMSQILPKNCVAVGVETAQLVHKLVELTDKRYKYMSKMRKKNPRLAFADFSKFNFKMIVCFIDEQSSITASLSDSKARKQYQNDLLRLVQTSRGAGIVPIISMQQASASLMGGTLGTAIREQLQGLKILMGSVNSISSQDKQMVFNAGVELPVSRFDGVGSGYLQTADMSNPEPFEAPLLPPKSEDLYKLLSQK